MKRVLITGATGFIGRNCVPLLLAKGYEIHAVSSKVSEKTCPDIHWHQVDLLDLYQCKKLMTKVRPTHLLHLAWYVTPGKVNSLENFQWVQSSLTILQFFSQNGGNRVVMVGSCFEYNGEYGYCSEKTTPLSPTTPYGICKHSLQIMLDAFTKQTGLSSAWARVFFLYGPYENPNRLVPSVICSLLSCKPALCSQGNQIRDYLHVEDVASALIAILESEAQGPINVASGIPIALKDVIYKIAGKLNNNNLIQLGAIPMHKHEPHLLVADVRRLLDEVGWQPKYDLDNGLEQTIEWWKSRVDV